MTELAGLTWPQAGEFAAAGGILAVPVGATEQHGPHLPHRGRGLQPVPDHVPDDERDASAAERDRVEPVPAGRLIVPGDQIARRDPDLR